MELHNVRLSKLFSDKPTIILLTELSIIFKLSILFAFDEAKIKRINSFV